MSEQFLGTGYEGENEIDWYAIDIKEFKPYKTSSVVPKNDRVKVVLDIPTKEAFKLKKQIEVPNIFLAT